MLIRNRVRNPHFEGSFEFLLPPFPLNAGLESYKKYVADLKAKKAAGGTQPAPGGASQRPGTQPPAQANKGGPAAAARAVPIKPSQMPKTPAEDPGVLGKRPAEGDDAELGPDAGLR